MPGPDAQPTPTPRLASPRAAPVEWVRNGVVWMVLIALIAFLVVETAIASHPHGWRELGRGMPHVVMQALLHTGIAAAIAGLLHALLRRRALWIALVVVFLALYPAAGRWRELGDLPTQAWMWIPFAVLLGLAAMHAVPLTLREAAAVDRAGPVFMFRAITLPLAARLLLGSCVFLVAIAIHPLPARSVVIAHFILALALIADAILGRRRR